ncbi:teichoic acid biosynthesis protein F, partial [Staphylococcus gallinarum]
NKTPYIIQSNTKLYYKFIHNDPINAPSLTQEEHEDRILQRVRALKEGLLKCIDPEIAKKVKIEAMRYYLYKVIKSDLFTNFSSEMYEIYQLLNEIFNYPSNEIKLSKRHSFEINAIKNGNLKKAFMLSKS